MASLLALGKRAGSTFDVRQQLLLPIQKIPVFLLLHHRHLALHVSGGNFGVIVLGRRVPLELFRARFVHALRAF